MGCFLRFVFFCSVSFCVQAYAGDLNPKKYDIYYGDVTGFGFNDIYFHPKTRITLIKTTVLIPLRLPKEVGFFIPYADYPNSTETQPLELSKEEIEAKGLQLANENWDYFYGDFNGDGIRDLIVRGVTSSSPAIELFGDSGTAYPEIGAVYEAADAPSGYALSNRSVSLTVVDANGDGRDDLVSYAGNTAIHGYLSGSTELTFTSGYDFKSTTASTVVGAINGGEGVAGDGSANYEIPIAVAQGIGGVQPEISLTYSSGSGNGHAGVGWGLSGLSAIQRCAANEDFGGAIDSVDFDSNDHFCLDGQALVIYSGAYGDSEVEYRTRSESYTKIVSYGQAGSCTRNGVNVQGPEKFKVWAASGEVYEYGFTSDSRVEAAGCSDVITWAVNKEEDRYGNSANYHYAESAGDHYITGVDYNAGASRVTFEYVDRADTSTLYYVGTKIEQTKLLNKISSFEGGSLLREYYLKYEQLNSTSPSRLTRITECSAIECLPATQFNWSNNTTSSVLDYSQRISSSICGNSDSDCDNSDQHNGEYMFYPDVNGDGRSDVCYRGDSGIKCRLGTTQGFTGASISTNICANDSTLYGACNGVDNYRTIRFIDMNGDGLSDLVFRSDSGVRVMRSTGNDFVEFIASSICANGSSYWGQCNDDNNRETLQYPDLNGDSLPDVCYQGDHGINCFLNSGSGFVNHISTDICAENSQKYGVCNDDDNSKTISYVDVDADGMADLVVRTDNDGVRVWRFNGSGFSAHFSSGICSNHQSGNVCNDEDNHYSIKFPDVTGDGIADLCYRSDAGVRCEIGTGYSWSGGSIITDICGVDASLYGVCNDNDNYRTISYADFNNDGRSDLYFRSDSGIYIFKSTGTGFEKIYSSSICGNNDSNHGACDGEDNHDTIQITDFDGNGLADIAYRGDDGVQLWPLYQDRQNLITNIVNGLGVETKFTYKSLIDPTVYSKTNGSEITYPEMEIVHSGKVVSSLEKSNGLGAYNSTSYRYKGLRVHQKGFGMLGFTEMTVINDDTGISVKTVFSMDYGQRLHGETLEVITIAADGTTELLRSENEWHPLASWGGGDRYRYHLKPSKTTRVERDLNGSFLTKEVTRTPAYATFGFPRQIITELFEEGGAVPVRTATMDFDYDDDRSRWFIGRKKRLTTTVAVPGRATRKKVASWEYDVNTSRMTVARVHEPVTDTVIHETRYGEDINGAQQVDVFGNNLSITVLGPDFLPRESQVVFDASGRRPIAKISAAGLALETDYYAANDTSVGAYPHKPKFVTDANGLIVHTQFDSFGRLTSTSSAWGSSVQRDAMIEYRSCDANCPSAASFYVVSRSDASPEGRVFKDILGRTILEKRQVIRKLGDAPTWVNVEYQYDHLGQNNRVSEPYFEGDTASLWTVSEYDDLGRAFKVTYPDGRVDDTIFNGLSVTTRTDINGKNQQNTATKNILGELSWVEDNYENKLSYTHDAHGNLLTTTDPMDNKVVVTYDTLGRKIGLNDPDKGPWSYTHNGLGQLISQTNARGETVCNAYDISGRLISRIDNYQGAISSSIGQTSQSTNQCSGDTNNPDTAVWVYDSAQGAALGKLHKVVGKDGYVEEVVYDNLGRAQEGIKSVNGETYRTATSFDTLGRPETVTYPGVSNRLQTRNIYNALGMLIEVRNAIDNTLYYQFGELDARGNIISEWLGNGVETRRSYKTENGRLDSIVSDIGMTYGDIQNLQFNFDDLGNLDYREDYRNNFREDFTYDSNNRLLVSSANYGNNDIRTTSVSYDTLGNILTKSGVGGYKYGSQCANGFGPHAVCEVYGTKNAAYTYDANGNMLTGDVRSISYTSFDKPNQIIKGLNTTDILYGPSRSRYFRKDTVDIAVTQYTYVGGIYEKVEFLNDGVAVNKTEERHFIGGFAILTMEDRSAGSPGIIKTRYLHKDHIGSITTITDEMGSIVEELSFDPWGKRRAASLDELEFLHGPWAGLTANQKDNLTTISSELSSSVTNKGFTGHEQMDSVGLIHMNGRVYDAELGRFIQADPIIQSGTDLQAYNRYSYVRNNPLSLVDPSGYSWLSKQYKKLRKSAVSAWHTMLKYSLNYQLTKKITNEASRFAIRTHKILSRNIGIYRNTTRYVANHKWSRDVITAIVAFYSKGNAAAMAGTKAAFALIRGASPNDIRRAGTTAFVSSVIAPDFTNTGYNPVVNFAISRATGYALGAATNGGHFGSFKNYMKGWAESAALTWAVGSVLTNSGGSSGGNTASCNPINIATGEKYLTMKDYQASGASLLKFERYYSSYTKEKTSLGYGWRSNYDNKLVFNAKKPEKSTRVKAIRSEKGAIYFELTDKKDWKAVGRYESLKKTRDGWTIALTNNRIEHYDTDGRLTRIQELGGYEQVLHYGDSASDQGRLVAVSDSFHQQIRFEYNNNGLLSALIAPDDTVTRYEYDRFSSLEKVISTEEIITGVNMPAFKQYLHQDSRFVHAITGIVNHAGERIHTMAYDERGRAVLSALGDSAEIAKIAFHGNHRSTVTNSLGKRTSYTFSENNKPLKIEGHASASCIAANQGYKYNEQGLLTSKTDWNGIETRYQYNDRGLEISRIEAIGTEQERKISTHWNKHFRLPIVIAGPMKIVKLKYNRQGLLTRRTEIDTQSQERNTRRRWTYKYNKQNLLASIDGPRKGVKDITQFEYDEKGNKTAVINALGHRAETTDFNPRGLPLIVKDINGVETQLSYNARGWLLSKKVVAPLGNEITRYTYTGASDYAGQGLVKYVVLPNGNEMHYEYDSARRLISETNGQGERIDYTLDLEGNRLATSTRASDNKLLHTQRQVFDELSRVVKSIGADGATTTYQYDKAGRRIGVTDALGNKTSYAYDALNRIISTTNASGVIDQDYNALNQITLVRDQRGLVTRYHYNGFGEKITQISPDTGTTYFEYNRAGQVTKKIDARGKVDLFKNDALGRVTDIQYPAANDENIHFVFDQYKDAIKPDKNNTYLIGRLAEMHDASGQTVYQYNHRGQVVTQDYGIGEHDYQIAYHYGRFGALEKMVYPSGRTVDYDYSQQGALAQVNTQLNGQSQLLVKDFNYQAFGPLQGFTYGNGSSLSINRDQKTRITDIRVMNRAANDAIYDVGFIYDSASNITAINDALVSSNSQRFDYDNSYRLVKAKGHYGEMTYAYDGVGNRLSREQTKSRTAGSAPISTFETYAYAEDSNRLLSVVSVGNDGLVNNRYLDYDAVGNIVDDVKTDSSKSLLYGARNRLEKVDLGEDGKAVFYSYNAKGQRVSKLVDGITTHFHYDIADRMIAETSVGDVEQYIGKEFIYAEDRRIAMVDYTQLESVQVLFVVNDHLGTPQILLSMSEEVVWQMQASPFGEVTSTGSGVSQPLRFPGQYADKSTGYSYNYFRDYDASIGRYIQSDPIGLNGGVNTFGYVRGNPILRFDPHGLVDYVNVAISAGGIIFGGAEAVAGGTGIIASSALLGTGFGVPIAVPGFIGSSALVVHGTYNVVDSYQGLLNAINETNHAGPLSQIAGALFGDAGGEYGKILDNVVSFRGALASGKGFIDGLWRGKVKTSDVHGVIATGKKHYDSHGNEIKSCPL